MPHILEKARTHLDRLQQDVIEATKDAAIAKVAVDMDSKYDAIRRSVLAAQNACRITDGDNPQRTEEITAPP